MFTCLFRKSACMALLIAMVSAGAGGTAGAAEDYAYYGGGGGGGGGSGGSVSGYGAGGAGGTKGGLSGFVGGNSQGGAGGNGGEAVVTRGGVDTPISSNHGNGTIPGTLDQDGGVGGSGGYTNAYPLGVSSFGNLTIHGGDGGGGGEGIASYGNGGAGGPGGALDTTANNDINVAGNFQLTGGSGGKGGDGGTTGPSPGQGGAGGAGGAANLHLATRTMTVAGNFTMANGSKGDNGVGNGLGVGGTGGEAFFEVGRLSANNITLTQITNNPLFLFRANEIAVRQNSTTTLHLNGTGAGSSTGNAGVYVGGLSFAGDSTLKVTSTNSGTMKGIGNISVVGPNNRYDAPTGLPFDAKNGQLTFALDGVEAGQTMLSAPTGKVQVGAASIIRLTSVKDALRVYEGDEFMLLDGADGIIAAYQPTQIVQGPLVNRYLAVNQQGGKLLATVTGMQSVESAVTDDLSLVNANLLSWSRMGDAILDAPSIYVTIPEKVAYEQYQAALINLRNKPLSSYSYAQGYGEYAASNLMPVIGANNMFLNKMGGGNESQIVKMGITDERVFVPMRVVDEKMLGIKIEWDETTRTATSSHVNNTANPSLILPCDAVEPSWKSRLWSSATGSWARQDERDGISGYQYRSRGAALGYDRQIGNFNLGFAAAYSHGNMDNDNLRQSAKADILNLGLYGRYENPTNGFFANAALAYGHAWNSYEVDMYIGGVKEADYQSADLTAAVEFGKRFMLPKDFNLLVSAGLTYDHLYSQGYAETYRGDNPLVIPNTMDRLHDNSLAIPLTLRVNRLFPFGCNGGFVVPEARATYTYQAVEASPYATVGLVGYPGYSARIEGVDPGRNRFRVGAGLSGQFNQRVGFAVNYDAEFATGFVNQAVSAQIGVNF